MNLIWSAVGPFLGYVNSVFTNVCVRGEEMDCKLIIDGDVRASAPDSFWFDLVRESRLNIDPEPDCEAWWRMTRLRRASRSEAGMDTFESSRVCPVLLAGSGEVAVRGGTGDVTSREGRGLKMEANIDRRRFAP